MKTTQTLTAAAIAAALSLPFAGAALADNTPAIDKTDTVMLAANTMDDAGDAVSDTWITTKVKSTLLAEDATPGMDIEVETKDGVVSLSGTVATEAEKEVAISKAKGIKGVRDVAADGLKAAE
ncbi:BON domain-containing protein [Pseudomonas kunmingensis]|uniref:BON domain-containing protein n=1 Tax=Stutzerimonas stutzeri subgroup TaxID=578833 RepID=UPI000254945F|nr:MULTISPECIES: BON domain-containing protein [Stutzerimonas stutzeri subgroup]KRW65771.1 osmY [Pseudomonas sp. TTU2014-105ASC]MDH2243751.1 BON domain-containing protein [Pseudomonas sp. GD03909]MDH2247569.1 BON domain-containing protein [Pseudomonas sp. GD03856]MDH2266504.1 BON domain-containing protein [Pseudomonas sp. GD03855]EHY76522.1 osmY-related protein [Stutzerimonas stutzeri ATCC 14405 = CCUG 16156]